jgi:hypothetical protein
VGGAEEIALVEENATAMRHVTITKTDTYSDAASALQLLHSKCVDM